MRSAPDPQSLLQRVLLLERQQGFMDRAAIGGLSLFAAEQEKRAGEDIGRPLAAAVVALQGYTAADRRGREAAVSSALALLLAGDAAHGGEEAKPAGQEMRVEAPEIMDVPPARAVTATRSTRQKGHRSRPKLTIVRSPSDLETPIVDLKAMRKLTAEALERLSVTTVRDLLYFFPRTHYDYTDTRSISRMRFGQKTTLVGTVDAVKTVRTRRGMTVVTAVVSDESGTVAVRWFNQPYLAKNLPVGARIAVSGEPDLVNGSMSFQPRDYEIIHDAELTHAARLVPIYPLTRGLYQRSLRQLVRRVLDAYAGALQDHLPADLRQALMLPVLTDAVRSYHFPESDDQHLMAQRRLAFDELLLMQLGLLMRKRDWQGYSPDAAVPANPRLTDDFRASLSFDLTRAQRHVIDEILIDMSRPIPMSRLLQGDVGSGKTVVAALALLHVARAGKQGVLMAPTEILAEQHFRSLRVMLAPFGVRVALLTGSTSRAERAKLSTLIQDGTMEVLVGTHALIQEGVQFARLGLAITDEQHRFGVEQRATLRQKGLHPHMLAMTATPIPRTLAITLYGDLDLSVLDEMPPGRLPVVTTWARTPAEAYGVVRDEVSKGHQAFVICPVIEESADADMRSVLSEHQELQERIFPDLRVALLHGRMKARDKDETLEAFRTGESQIIVATSVIEVGIDIPNATAMVIRDAHRFGLAQLHQFRGRVGRGGEQSFCVLLSATEGDDARERLEALTAMESGFDLAEEDLRLRGPGEFWGTRQSGLPELQVANLADVATMEEARETAKGLLDEDPSLEEPDHGPLREQVSRFWKRSADLS